VGSIVGATARTVPALIGAFVLIGASAGAGLSFFWVLSELVPMNRRFIANSLLYFLSLWSTGLGAKVATAFLDTSTGWRGTLWVMTALNGTGALCWALFYFPPTFEQLHRSKSLMTFATKFDYVGFVLFVAGTLLFLLGLSWGGGSYPWSSAHVLATLIVGAVCLITLGFWCAYAKLENPFLPTHLLSDARFMAVVCIETTGAMSYYAFAVIWPAAVAVLYPNLSASDAGWLSTTTSLCFLMGQTSGNVLAAVFEPKYVLWVAVPGALALVAAVAANPSNLSLSVGLLVPGLLCVGISDGLAITMSTMVIDDQDEIGTAGGISGAIRSLGGTVASAIYSSVLTNRLAQTIPQYVLSAAIGAGLPASSGPALIEALTSPGTTSLAKVPGINASIRGAASAAYQIANSEAYKTVFLTTIAFSGLSMIALWWVPKLDPRKKSYVSRTIQREGFVNHDTKQVMADDT
jgi:MFS family permease